MWKMHLHDEGVDSQAANPDLQQSQTLLNTTCIHMHCGMLQHGKGNFCTSSQTLLIWPIQSGRRVQSTINIYEIY